MGPSILGILSRNLANVSENNYAHQESNWRDLISSHWTLLFLDNRCFDQDPTEPALAGSNRTYKCRTSVLSKSLENWKNWLDSYLASHWCIDQHCEMAQFQTIHIPPNCHCVFESNLVIFLIIFSAPKAHTTKIRESQPTALCILWIAQTQTLQFSFQHSLILPFWKK